ncbi:MAG TPA: hypothetical protein VGO91_11845 [Pyrinomonadaceae bacterium]|nr:hypothetical protein [Pyrinomonadaceae bacterium]
MRQRWLNPPEWTRAEVLEFPGSVNGPWARYVHEADARGVGTVRYPRLVLLDAASAGLLAKRTLTNLYNGRPTWLDLAHRRLDEAVARPTAGTPPSRTKRFSRVFSHSTINAASTPARRSTCQGRDQPGPYNATVSFFRAVTASHCGCPHMGRGKGVLLLASSMRQWRCQI